MNVPFLFLNLASVYIHIDLGCIHAYAIIARLGSTTTAPFFSTTYQSSVGVYIRYTVPRRFGTYELCTHSPSGTTRPQALHIYNPYTPRHRGICNTNMIESVQFTSYQRCSNGPLLYHNIMISHYISIVFKPALCADCLLHDSVNFQIHISGQFHLIQNAALVTRSVYLSSPTS